MVQYVIVGYNNDTKLEVLKVTTPEVGGIAREHLIIGTAYNPGDKVYAIEKKGLTLIETANVQSIQADDWEGYIYLFHGNDEEIAMIHAEAKKVQDETDEADMAYNANMAQAQTYEYKDAFFHSVIKLREDFMYGKLRVVDGFYVQ